MANSLLEGAAFFTAVQLRLDHASKAAVTRAARLVRDEAKRVLGTYDYGWPRLAESTIEHKTTGDSPLLETGALRRSIKYSVSGSKMNWHANVGSNDPKALWHELGTRRIPPRSFLGGAAKHKEKEVHKICGHDMLHHVFGRHDHEFDNDYGTED